MMYRTFIPTLLLALGCAPLSPQPERDDELELNSGRVSLIHKTDPSKDMNYGFESSFYNDENNNFLPLTQIGTAQYALSQNAVLSFCNDDLKPECLSITALRDAPIKVSYPERNDQPKIEIQQIPWQVDIGSCSLDIMLGMTSDFHSAEGRCEGLVPTETESGTFTLRLAGLELGLENYTEAMDCPYKKIILAALENYAGACMELSFDSGPLLP